MKLFCRFVLLAGLLGLMATSVGAATRTWDNGNLDFLWGNETNWDGTSPGNGIPAAADIATFGATGVGIIDLGATTRTISTLFISTVGYTFTNGTMSLNTISNTFPNGTTPVISAGVTDQSSAGLTISHSSGDCSGFTINGQITIGNTGSTALQVVWNGSQRTGTYTLGSPTLANTVAGGVLMNSRLNGGVSFQGAWTIGGDFKMINGSSSDNGGNTLLKGTISIGGNLISAVPNNANDIDIFAGSTVSVAGDMNVQGATTTYYGIRVLQSLKLGGNINVSSGLLGVNVTNPFLDYSTGLADTSKAVLLGATNSTLDAGISLTANGVTLNNPITVQSANTGAAILASGATVAGNQVTYAGTITLNKPLTINAPNTAGAILNVTSKISGGSYVAINNGAYAGTVKLSNTGNDYTGGTIVNNGILQYNAAGAITGSGRNITINAPGVVALGYVPAGSIQSDLLSRIVTSSSGAAVLTASTSENFDFSSSVNNFTALSLGAAGSATYSGTLTPNGTTYRLGGGGGTLTFTPGGGTFDSTRDLVINGNGLTGTVDFGGAGKSFGAITISGGTVQNGTLTGTSFDLQGGTVNAVLVGPGVAPNKTGSGTLTFSGTTAQTFTGGLTVSGGTLTENFANLAASPNNNLIDSGNVLTLAGGTLSLIGKNNIASLQAFVSTTITSNRSSTITLARTGTGTMTLEMGAITRNTGSVLKFSTAPDASTILATTTATNDASGILGTWTTVSSGTNLQYAMVSGGQIIRYPDVNATVATPADLSNMINKDVNYSIAKPAGGTTLTGSVTGNTLRVTSTSDNPIVVNTPNSITLNGLIGVGANRTIISGTGNLVIGPSKELVIHWTASFSAIACPIVDNPAGASSVTINIPQNGEFDVQGAKTYTGGTTIHAVEQLNFNVNSFGSGPITVNGGVRLSSRGGGSLTNSLTLNGAILYAGTYSGPITLASASSVGLASTVSGNMSGPGSFTINAATTISGVNTYSGGTYVNSAGTISMGSANALGTGPLYMNGGQLTAGVDLSGGTGVTNNIVLLQNGTINANFNMLLSGVISGYANLVKAGNNNLTLSGANTFYGSPVVNAGKLVVNNSLALQNSTLAYANTNISFAGSIINFTVGGLTGTNNLALTDASAGAIILSVGNNSCGSTYSGVLSGPGSLTKVGGGTLILTATNTYTGYTAVSNGTLSVPHPLALNTNAIYLSSTATLNLNFSGAMTNYMLTVDGVPRPTGTYGSNNVTQITGPGKLVTLWPPLGGMVLTVR